MNKAIAVGAALTVVLIFATAILFVEGSGERDEVAAATVTPFISKGCNGCHVLNGFPGNTQIGPDLTQLDKVADHRVDGLSGEEYIRQSVREPQAYVVPGYPFVMPTLSLTGDQVDQIVALLLSPDES